MKKIMIMAAALVLAFGASAAAANGYLYWTLNPVEDSLAFAYVKVLGVDANGESTVLNSSSGGVESSPVIFGGDAEYPVTVTSLETAYYTLIPEGIGWKNFYVELYNWEGAVVGVSQQAVYDDLLKPFVYSDMSTAGIVTPYQFTANIPEPSGGMLFLIGLGVLALRRRKADAEQVNG